MLAQSSHKQPSLFRRVFIALSLISAITSIVVLVIATAIYQSSLIADAGAMLEDECNLVASTLGDGADEVAVLQNFELSNIRSTLVAVDGTVLFDNENDAATMPNHLDRPEISEALKTGSGASERESETEGKVVIYRARLLGSGNVLRLEIERDSTAEAIRHELGLVAIVTGIAVLISWLLARFISRRLMQPIVNINPSNPDVAATYVELNPVINQISEQISEIRNSDLMRREFTANVTHELKTPLSSISGASELIRDGIARPEDIPEFAGRIYDEAAHMTELVNDILTLSKLDEAERSQDLDYLGQFEPVDLHQAALAVCRRLDSVAKRSDVELECRGDAVVISGLPRLLDDLIFNLVDNGIRYNRKGGKVIISTAKENSAAVLKVVDTGIGIPEEARSKVFERFYRVDSSRAREKGGTGLGLAIVKHATAVHGAEVTIDSFVGTGTTVTVVFPLAE